jgi:hypothetical protein
MEATHLHCQSRVNGLDNGKIAMPLRELGENLGMSQHTAGHVINELATLGFIVRTKASSFSKKRSAAEYLMTS